MPIYTKSGDGGKTSLLSGERVEKSDMRVEAYGDLDELCAYLGYLIALIPSDNIVIHEIKRIQSVLLEACAWLATTPGSISVKRLKPFLNNHVEMLEERIDRMESELPEMKGFILPGGHIAASVAHIARTVCRRAERHIVSMIQNTSEAPLAPSVMEIKSYINRLSDYLFVLARYLNKEQGVMEIFWKDSR